MNILQEYNGQFRLTIPTTIVDVENWKKGQKFKWIKVQGYYALEPMR